MGMRILFITHNRIGDAILSTGILGALIGRYPEARITVACGPATVPLFSEISGVTEVISLTKGTASSHWFKLWGRVAGRRWDMVVDLRSSAIAWVLLAKQRFILKKAREPVHRVKHLSDLLGIDPPAAPRIEPGKQARARAKELLQGLRQPILAIGPTANWPGKQWPAERFAELIRRLRSPQGILPDAPVLVLGAEAEREMAAPVLQSVPPDECVDLIGKTNLLEAYACLEAASLYIGNDSGLMHLAAAAGIPTLGLFGPSLEELYAPWGDRTATVRGTQSYIDIINAPGYDHRMQVSHMHSLSVDGVEAAAQVLWQRCGQMDTDAEASRTNL